MSDPGTLFKELASGPGPSRLGGLRALDTTVEVAEGPVIVAMSADGIRHLLVPVQAETTGPADLGAAVSIRLRTLTDAGQDRRFVDVECTEARLHDLFDTVSTEMLDAIAADPDGDHRKACQRVLDRWRQLLRRLSDRLLGPEQLAGLLAELWWLSRVAETRSDQVLKVWRGPEGAPHDLIGPGTAVEVKAVSSSGRVEIHGIDQLEPPTGAELFLACVHLGPAVLGDHVTVPGLVDRLSDQGVDTVDLLTVLSRIGYDHAEREVYETFAWTVTAETIHRIDDTFPKLSPSATDFGSHPAISAVRYAVELQHCPPAEDLDPEDLAHRLAEAP